MSSSLSEVGGEGIGVTTGVGFAESIGVAAGVVTGGTLKWKCLLCGVKEGEST
jgi:hypothetical protein